ncbi:MAG: hypothetical protein WBM80_02605 [Woeseiaceae bacterium]
MSPRILFAFWFAVSPLSMADALAETGVDYNKIFEDAVAAVDFDFHRTWAYTETHVDAEHVWVGRSDPRRPARERWQLISVDARAPTAAEIKKYRKEKAHQHSDDGEHSVAAIVEPGSIRLIEETDEYWLLGFNPDDEENIIDSVDATIRVNKAHRRLEYIDLRNHETIKPAFGVKISKLITRLTFAPAADGGPVVPVSTHVEATGRAYIVVTFDEQEVTRNSDFENVAADLKMVPDR